MAVFNEDNTTEQLIISTLVKNGWEYIPADDLSRDESDVMVEPMVRDALVRLNPEIAAFIKNNRERCYIVTGNLDVWISGLMDRIGMRDHCLCSRASALAAAALSELMRILSA